MEKYLIMKLDEESLLHLPERISEVPALFDATIPEGELHQYQQIVLRGDGVDIKTLETIIFGDMSPAYVAHIIKKLHKLNSLIDNELEFNDPTGKRSDSKDSTTAINLHS